MSRSPWPAALLITLGALALRLAVALLVAEDSSGDGPVYRRAALNILEHGVYSTDDDEPHTPTFIRMPGTSLVQAGLFSLFGKEGLDAVHAVQAVVDTATCWLVALLALLLVPPGWDAAARRRLLLGTLVLAAVCPFTMVYAGTLLSETWALFTGTLCVVASAWALKAGGTGAARWAAAGLAGGLACMFRPDLGLYLAAPGALVVLSWFLESRAEVRRAGGWRAAFPATRRAAARGFALSAAFAAALTPWTLRNVVEFQLFEPLASPTATMPGEFVARGYGLWLKTWLTRPRDVEPFVWDMDERPVDVDRLPDDASDSPAEREQVLALLERYNAGSGDEPAASRRDRERRITPELDAAFRTIAQERIRRDPFRSHVVLPALRALHLWFDPHTDFYPFDGPLLPLEDLDVPTGQHLFLPLFALLCGLYTLAGLAGARALWRDRGSRRWVLLAALLFFPRLAFLSTLPNPEPRYMVEMLPVVAALGGFAIGPRRAAGGPPGPGTDPGDNGRHP